MAMSPRQVKCQERIAGDVPACLAGVRCAQAVADGMVDPSQSLVLLRSDGGQKRGIEGVCCERVIENELVRCNLHTPGGVCQLMDVACLDVKQDQAMDRSEARGMNRALVAA